MKLFLKLFFKKGFSERNQQKIKKNKKPQNNSKKSSRSKLLDTDGIPERIFRKNKFEKQKQTTDDKNHEKIPSRQRVNL